MHPSGASRRFVVLLITVAGILSIFLIATFRNAPDGTRHPGDITTKAVANAAKVEESTLKGHVIAPKLGNATVKAELGRASWKLLHTTFARFPDKPTDDESNALNSYIHLFHRLYPCGECAEHFTSIIEKYPPQTSSRSAAAAWGCHVHNEVNKALHKEIFDCSKIGDFYDCGCADDGKEHRPIPEKTEMSKKDIQRLTGAGGRGLNTKLFEGRHEPPRLEKEE